MAMGRLLRHFTQQLFYPKYLLPLRPTKLTQNLLHALQSVLADELAVIAFTEEELVWQTNQQLPMEERITYRTFQRYKAVVMSAETGEDSPKPPPETPADRVGEQPEKAIEPDIDPENTELVRQMHVTIKDALMKQKLALVKGVYAQQPNWRRFCWMLERKFPDFRLKLPTVLKAPQPEAAIVTQPTANLPKPVAPAAINAIKKEADEAEKAKKLVAWMAKAAADKAAEEAIREANKPKTVEEKWERRTHLPWKPMPLNTTATFEVRLIKSLETEMQTDVAAGYLNPYAHLEYRPHTVDYVGGYYKCYGMGDDKLPYRVHLSNEDEAPEPEQLEALWIDQQRVRNNVIRFEQGLPSIPPPDEENPYSRRGSILGHSG